MVTSLLLFVAAQASGSVTVVVQPADEGLKPAIQRYADVAQERITSYMGHGFPRPVTLQVCPSRAAFDHDLAKRWHMPKTEPWMVGAGGGDVLFLLSPRVWKTEAVEHNPDKEEEISDIVCHELVHSYHCQINPTRDLDGLDEMAWLIEGVATYVSGQLDRSHRGVAEAEAAAGRSPATLDAIWLGKKRYGLAGSLVRYVDRTYGRARLIRLLSLTSNAAALGVLGVSEDKLLADWVSSLRS